jgi:serine protease inhibitor
VALGSVTRSFTVFFETSLFCAIIPTMKEKYRKLHIVYALAALLLVASLPACSGSKKKDPVPTATSAISVGDSSFADGRALELSFKLLYALDSTGGNNVLGTSGIVECLAAAKNGSSGTTDTAFAAVLGMQDMLSKQINDIALRLRQVSQKLKEGRISSAWTLYVGEGQAIKESYLTDCEQSLQLTAVFQQLDNNTGNKAIGEWADENTGGKVKKVNFKIPTAAAPFFVDVLEADPDWQLALDTGKSRPLPFKYEDGDTKAVPTMVCLQKCGVYTGPEGSMAVLPTSNDETRLIIMVPPAELSLHDFIPIAAAKHDDWMEKAQWKSQRVLLPRFQLEYEGSVMDVLKKAGISQLLNKGADYSNMGDGLYFSDILHKSSLTVDESGLDKPDSSAVYRDGIKDGIDTLAVNRPFIVALEKTGTGQIIMMGYVRDPLTATIAN